LRINQKLQLVKASSGSSENDDISKVQTAQLNLPSSDMKKTSDALKKRSWQSANRFFNNLPEYKST